MQQQKTEPAEPIGELPPLSVQEEALVEALGQGDDNTEAYRKAYGASGYSAPALHVQACRKVAEPKIQAHLRRLRSAGFAKAGLSLQKRLEAELAFAQRCEDAGNFGAAGGAYDRVNKLMGLYVERHEVVHHDPTEALRELATISPELAQSLADSLNVPELLRHAGVGETLQ